MSAQPAVSANVTAARGTNGELLDLRTATSNTYSDGGKLQTVFAPVPVNYQDDAGEWQQIDETLVPVGTARGRGIGPSWTNASDAHDITLPPVAGGAVVVSDDSLTVTSRLVGANGSAISTDDATATYAGVFPGVDQVYVSRSGALEQFFRLASKDAASTFTQSVTLSDGYTLAGPNAQGGVEIRDSAGDLAALIPAPVVQDSSGNPDTMISTDAVHLEVIGSAPTWTLRTVVDPAWLQSSQRTFPVIVDPSVTIGLSGALGCYVASGGSPAALCSSSGSSDNPLLYGFTAYKRRIYLKFPEMSAASSPIPEDAQVTDAVLSMKVQSASNTTPLDTDVHQPNGSWGSSITWANQPGTTPTPLVTTNVTPTVGATVNIGVVYLAQRWINGQAVNNGVVIKKDDENTAVNTITFYGLANANRPTMVVTWAPRIGAQKSIDGYGHRLNDRLSLRVSYANRNLMLASTDVAWKAPGVSMNMTRYWNSLGAAQGLAGAFGQGWSMNGGYDVRLELGTFGTTFVQPGGARIFFQRNPAFPEDNNDSYGYYSNRNGLNASLRKVAGSSPTQYVMVFKQTKQLYTFTVDPSQPTVAYLTKTTDRANGNSTINTTTGGWGTPARVPSTMTDSTGQRSLAFTNTDAAQGRVTVITENLAPGATGARTYNYGYDANKHLITYTDPAGKITRFCYTGDLITRVITPKGSDAGVTCATTGTALVNTTDIAYDPDGKVTTVTYRLGSSPAITLTFNETTPLDRTNSVFTGIVQFEDPYLQKTKYYFDVYDRVNKVVTPKGNTTTAAFNTNDDVTASVSPINYLGGASDLASTNTYDADNNLTKSQIPSGASVQSKYVQNQPTVTTDDRDPLSPDATTSETRSRMTYTDDRQLATFQKGASTQTRKYDDDVNNCGPGGASGFRYALCSVEDAAFSTTLPARHVTKYSYNAMGEVASITPPAPGGSRATPAAKTYSYDGFSRVTSMTNSRGQTTSFTYDALDRLTRQTYNNGSYTELAYDVDGNLLTRTDKTSGGTPTSSQTNGYDAMNRMTSEQPDNGATNTVTWDGNSRMATFTDASGTTTYGYNEDSVVTSITLPGGNCTGVVPKTSPPSIASRCIVYDLNKSNQRLGVYWPGGIKQLYTYDASGRITEIVATRPDASNNPVTELSQKYGYQPSGGTDTAHLLTRINSINNRTSSYDYTDQGWLYTETNKATNTSTITSRHTFCYDANGNRTIGTFTNGAGTVTCSDPAASTWDGANQQLTGPTGTAADYTFDVDGNETSTGTSLNSNAKRTSTWNDRDQNTANTIGASGSLLNTYLGAGNAAPRSKQINSTQTHELRNSFLGTTEVATRTGASITDVTYVRRDPNGNIVAFTNLAGDTFYPLSDRMGSIWVVLNSSGTTVYEVGSYAPYGQPTVTVTNTSYSSLFGYTGAYTNPATGLVHLAARYYDPTLGRFTQTDPSNQERNPYTYASNDPVNRTDPTGLWSFEISGQVCAFGGCIGGSIGVDSDWDVNVGFQGGIGTPGIGGGVNYDADGNYDEGLDTGGSVSCSFGYASATYSDDGLSGGLSGPVAETPGCSATADLGYTF